MIRGLYGISLNTFREAVRQPFYYLLAGTALAAILITMHLPLFTFYNDTDMYKDLGLSFMLLFLLLAALLAAATGIAREVEDKTAHTILSKSGGRWQFIVGKYLGVLGGVGLATAALGVVFAVAVYYRVAIDAGVMEKAFAAGGLGRQVEEFRQRQFYQALTVVPGVVMVFLQVAVLAAVATALSTRFSSTASVALSLVAFVVGHLTAFLEGATRGAGGLVQALAQAVLAVLPFLEIFNINEKLSHVMLVPTGPGSAAWIEVWSYVGWSAAYAVAYIAAAIIAGVVLFRRRSLA